MTVMHTILIYLFDTYYSYIQTLSWVLPRGPHPLYYIRRQK